MHLTEIVSPVNSWKVSFSTDTPKQLTVVNENILQLTYTTRAMTAVNHSKAVVFLTNQN